jgi:hypothetical protein|nr:MAG TPA: hypothetical protein [Caudoviricetes sp.]DAS33737.1 MAG TPA: hypothetical protein [Caudoviricetes sp.]DAS70575.1 MAG TPA: hypothetical protein [Caudoviricetes sp.]
MKSKNLSVLSHFSLLVIKGIAPNDLNEFKGGLNVFKRGFIKWM